MNTIFRDAVLPARAIVQSVLWNGMKVENNGVGRKV